MMDEVESTSCSSLTTAVGTADELENSTDTWTCETTDVDSDSGVAIACGGDPKIDMTEDVAPVFILQPKEIIKNIDLMKTVAVLMENKLQPSVAPKRLDLDKVKELHNDIQRFPEAFQKFVSIIHQIQYLNVTSDWNFSNEESISNVQPLSSRGSIMSRLFGSEDKHKNPCLTECDKRKKVMLQLLTILQQVFTRYLKIQNTLEERLKKCNEFMVKLVEQSTSKQYNISLTTTDSEEDDPNLPLLVTNNKRNSENKLWLEKVEFLRVTLRRTKRSAGDVQDSLEVLRDLILWDYKQAVSSTTINTDEGNCSGESGNPYNGAMSDNTCVEVALHQCSTTNDDFQFHSNSNSRRMWTISALLAGIIVVLVIIATLSFMRFHY